MGWRPPRCKKQIPGSGICFFGAGDRTRTGTVSLPVDFESTTSANSTTRAHLFRKKGTFVLPLPKENEGPWLREEDLNLRPPGYEPDELPTALPRDILVPVTGLEPVRYLYQGILSPARLPISPHRQITSKM